MTKYPHDGVMPGLGCGCPRCKEPHKIESRVIEPGTPEHEAWVIEQERKRQNAERKFDERSDQIGRPKHWR